MTFMIHRQMRISATRTAHDGTTRCFLFIGQINSEFCLVFLITAGVWSAIWP